MDVALTTNLQRFSSFLLPFLIHRKVSSRVDGGPPSSWRLFFFVHVVNLFQRVLCVQETSGKEKRMVTATHKSLGRRKELRTCLSSSFFFLCQHSPPCQESLHTHQVNPTRAGSMSVKKLKSRFFFLFASSLSHSFPSFFLISSIFISTPFFLFSLLFFFLNAQCVREIHEIGMLLSSFCQPGTSSIRLHRPTTNEFLLKKELTSLGIFPFFFKKKKKREEEGKSRWDFLRAY